MSGGGIIIQRTVIATAVSSSAIYDALPPACKDRVELVLGKPVAEWNEDETSFMASMPLVAVHVSEV